MEKKSADEKKMRGKEEEFGKACCIGSNSCSLDCSLKPKSEPKCGLGGCC
jgi:hypothetical protein